MAGVTVYLTFAGETEAAFEFYKTVFNTKYDADGLNRFGDMPPQEGMPELTEEEKKLILHVGLPILGNFVLMGSDAAPGMQSTITKGNNYHLNLDPTSREEADKIFAALSQGGTVTQALHDSFWGAYYGSCTDKYGIHWMMNYNEKKD